jgi:ribosomal protein S27AE
MHQAGPIEAYNDRIHFIKYIHINMDNIEKWHSKQKAKAAKWYKANRDSVNAKAIQYYKDNKERIKQKNQQLVQCPLCHTQLKQGSLSHHKNNNKCKLQAAYLYPGS